MPGRAKIEKAQKGVSMDKRATSNGALRASQAFKRVDHSQFSVVDEF
jgi:hypothetical protein